MATMLGAPCRPRAHSGEQLAARRAVAGSSRVATRAAGRPVARRTARTQAAAADGGCLSAALQRQRRARLLSQPATRPRGPLATREVPLLVKAARGEAVPRPPAWMMRQAGRYMQSYRDLAKRHPSFRERSETTDLICEISLQPWRAFRPDGVILFSDILTPLPGVGVPFDIDEAKGPLIASPIRTLEDVATMHPLDVSGLNFVGDSLRILRSEVGTGAAVLGFVGSPWTLATYLVEGKSTSTYTTIKTMAFQAPQVLHAILDKLADALAEYICFQAAAGAQAIMLFDSWGGQLPPAQWDIVSRPSIERMVAKVRQQHPNVPIVLYANGSGGLLERMATTGCDAVGLDWTVDMADARKRLGNKPVQGNVDPAVLFATPEAVQAAVKSCCAKAGPRGHILNLGHGVLVGTPEENVAAFFEAARAIRY